MPRVLLTAYGPYDDWAVNASWLVLQEITRELPSGIDLQTRLYPVDFAEVAKRLASDVTADTDVAIHLGQAPGLGRIELEVVGLNLAQERDERSEEAWPLVEGGPEAYFSGLPLASWAQRLRSDGVPAEVSHHAGTYLCNAALYLSQHIAAEQGFATQATFIHLPLVPEQVIDSKANQASLPVEVMAGAIRTLLESILAESGQLVVRANVPTGDDTAAG